MNLKIRRTDLTSKDDAETLIELLYAFSLEMADEDYPAAMPEETLVENIQKTGNSHVYFLEIDENIIGIAVCFAGFSTFKNRALLNIHDFFIRQEFRKKGYGTRFLQLIEKEAKGDGFCRITLEVYASNTKALNVYSSCGFTGHTGDRMMYFMSREL